LPPVHGVYWQAIEHSLNDTNRYEILKEDIHLLAIIELLKSGGKSDLKQSLGENSHDLYKTFQNNDLPQIPWFFPVKKSANCRTRS
jgi:hypothetical protein